MRVHRALRLGALAVLAWAAHADEGKEEQHERRYRIEVLYTIHARLDTDEKLARIRALVVKAYPEAKFAEVSAKDRRIYFLTFCDRLLAMAGTSFAALVEQAQAGADPKQLDAELREKIYDKGYAMVEAQVGREVELRSIYEFLHAQAKDDVSFKEIFEKLKAKDDPKDPVCSTEPGKALIVYRDFGGRDLTGQELTEIEDGGVKFGIGFRARVVGLGDDGLPKRGRKADGLGAEWEGRQIFRLLAVQR